MKKQVKLLKEVRMGEPYTLILKEVEETLADMYLSSIEDDKYLFESKYNKDFCEFTQEDINEGYIEMINNSPLWKSSSSTKKFIKENEDKDPDSWQKQSYNDNSDDEGEDEENEEKDEKPLQEDEIDMEQLKSNARQIKHCGDYGVLHVNHENGKVCWTSGDADCGDEYTSEEEIKNLLKVPGVTEVEVADEYYPGEEDGYEKVDFEKKEEAPKQKLKEDMTTADMASFDTPVGFNKKRMETFDPYKGMQNVVDGSKTRINEDIDQNFEVMPNTFKECEEKGKLQVIVKEGGKKKIYKFKESEFTKFIDSKTTLNESLFKGKEFKLKTLVENRTYGYISNLVKEYIMETKKKVNKPENIFKARRLQPRIEEKEKLFEKLKSIWVLWFTDEEKYDVYMYCRGNSENEAVENGRKLMSKSKKLVNFSSYSECESIETYIEVNGEDEDRLEEDLMDKEFINMLDGKILGIIYNIERV